MSNPLISGSLALLTDFYQITMAYGYWKSGLDRHEGVFHHCFRRQPFGGFTVAAGLEPLIHFLEKFKYTQDDLNYLANLKAANGTLLFEDGFFEYLSKLTFQCDVDAVPEGTVVFPYEPMVRVKGPLIQCQLLESPLLNYINFASLIATKAARVCIAAKGDQVVEFGLRRAQGLDGALTASRSSFIGGCESTSNVLAGKLFGIPVKGTMAHSWVMVFEDELASFEQYAKCLPNNTVFLVDTYDTIEGVKKAIEVGKKLKSQGLKFLGIRLDSGDLAYLSIKARELLDEADFKDSIIFASNELDEKVINELKMQGATISMWGVGTHLVTGKDHPWLDGVYKLSAVRKPEGPWRYTLKLSEQMVKVSNPGILQVRRFFQGKETIADMIFDINHEPKEEWHVVDPLDPTREKIISDQLQSQNLLVPIFREGKLVYKLPTLQEIQKNTQKELSYFHPGIKRFLNPHQYVVGMEKWLYDLKIDLIKKIRSKTKKIVNPS